MKRRDLADLLFAFGEERKSRRIAQFIVAARADHPIVTTLELARLIERAIGRKPGDAHPATRSFQALRIAVNAEFDELVEGLFAAERLLGEGGRLAVVTFHSLEDRIVKQHFRSWSARCVCPPELPICQCGGKARAVRLTPGAARPTAEEIARNPRARSARLRALEWVDER